MHSNSRKDASAAASASAHRWLSTNPLWQDGSEKTKLLLSGLAHETAAVLVFGARGIDRGVDFSKLGWGWHGVQCDFKAHVAGLRHAGREMVLNSDIAEPVRAFFKSSSTK